MRTHDHLAAAFPILTVIDQLVLSPQRAQKVVGPNPYPSKGIFIAKSLIKMYQHNHLAMEFVLNIRVRKW